MVAINKDKRKKIDYYVCPSCFNRVEECICKYIPHTLIEIDKNIQEVIRIFNQKNYYTGSCCEGHFINGKIEGYLYVSFGRSYDFKKFKNFPSGFEITQGNHLLRYVYPENITEDEFEKIKADKIKALLKFCKSLPKE